MGNNIWGEKQINSTHKGKFCKSDLQSIETQSFISEVMMIITAPMSDTLCIDISLLSSYPVKSARY